ncbi:uncharacterized protein LOC136038956 isoform X2 [Artemia franciscana]
MPQDVYIIPPKVESPPSNDVYIIPPKNSPNQEIIRDNQQGRFFFNTGQVFGNLRPSLQNLADSQRQFKCGLMTFFGMGRICPLFFGQGTAPPPGIAPFGGVFQPVQNFIQNPFGGGGGGVLPPTGGGGGAGILPPSPPPSGGGVFPPSPPPSSGGSPSLQGPFYPGGDGVASPISSDSTDAIVVNNPQLNNRQTSRPTISARQWMQMFQGVGRVIQMLQQPS